MPEESPRWSAEQVLALAPDPTSAKAGRGLGTARPWRETGCSAQPPTVWGLCQGSGATPYQTCVDLTEPAYRCSCPSRKFPCKHAIGLLLLWSDGTIKPAQPPSTAEPPDWVTEWLESRTGRKEKAAERADRAKERVETPATQPKDPAAAAATRLRRARRVEAGITELERWLKDQVRQGLATAGRAGYQHWDTMAARLVDAQAPGLASAVRRLAGVAATPERLLAELGLIWLLIRAYHRIEELPPEMAATVRSRVGFPVATEEVLATDPVRDEWAVVGLRDEADERLTVRRVWLRGTTTGRPALVLSFAAPGQSLVADLMPGTVVEADVCYYPGGLPLRAIVAQRHGEPRPITTLPGDDTIETALTGYAQALAAEPWLERWPVVITNAILSRAGDARAGDARAGAVAAGRWQLVDTDHNALPLDPAIGDPWRLVAAGGGAPATVAGEWSTAGLRPLSVFVENRLVRA